jgi:fatty acyl-ACP thioesterase B
MMNKLTRKLARIPDEVRTEIEPYFFEHAAIEDEDNRKFPKLPEHEHATSAKYVRTGLTVSFALLHAHIRLQVYSAMLVFLHGCFLSYAMQPRWADLDINQHVNNVKYIGWILEVKDNVSLLCKSLLISEMHKFYFQKL